MELFKGAHVVRLRSHHDKYLIAEHDHEHVSQDRSGASSAARWIVEFVENAHVLRLKSTYGRYLTATNEPFFLGVTGRKVIQSLPRRLVSPKLSKQESVSSTSSSIPGSPHRSDGRTICYVIADDDGNAVDGDEGGWFMFKGTSVAELTKKLEEETGMGDVFVCSRNPLNGKLYPLRLHLPPNNVTMKVVVVPASSKAARSFKRTENTMEHA